MDTLATVPTMASTTFRMFTLLRKSVQARKRLTAAKNAVWPSIRIDAASQVLFSERQPAAPPEISFDIPGILRDRIGIGFDPGETACVRRFDGALTVDPRSGLLFESGRAIWGSTDVPSLRERTPLFLRHRMRPRRRFDAVASLHHIFDNNYYHFFNNIAVKLPLFEAAGVPAGIPALVSQRLSEQPFFRDARAMGLFGDREIIVQGTREVIAARTVYTAKGFAFLDDRKRYEWVLDRLGVEREPAGDRRVFIRRGPKANNRRLLSNQAEFDRLLDRYDIERVDPQELDLAGQIATFASARLIVAPHGAGLMNMIFRRGSPLDIVELFNPNHVNPACYLMAEARGYGYHCLMNRGTLDNRWTASASVNIGAVDRILAKIDRNVVDSG